MSRILFLLCICVSVIRAEEILELDVIAYEDLMHADPHAMQRLDQALHEKGIVGVHGIPNYRERYLQFITAAREFSALPETVKEHYQPNRDLGETFLGYEMGKEKFQRPSGEWVVDDLKTSYYAVVPDNPSNKWPLEVDLRGPFEALGALMLETGELIMEKIGLLGSPSGVEREEAVPLGRMLYYRKSDDGCNPYWCGAHKDHGLFTVILPAVYFAHGELIQEPDEAGLFVRTSEDVPFKKVAADENVMMFQVGEFGQLLTNDGIRATEHRVHKAVGAVERYTLALFYNPPMATTIYSTSVLTEDTRYGTSAGEPCTYRHWHEATFERFLVKEEL